MSGDSARERAAARALSALPEGCWRAIHMTRGPGRTMAHVDHLLIGPPGVFVIDSSSWSFRDASKREAAAARVADSATAVAELVPGLDPHLVVPVLCCVGTAPMGGSVRDVMVCSTGNVVDRLTTQPAVFGSAYVDQVYERLQQAMPSLTSRTPAPGGPVRASVVAGPSRRPTQSGLPRPSVGAGPSQRPAQSEPLRASFVTDPSRRPTQTRVAHRAPAQKHPLSDLGAELSPPMRAALLFLALSLMLFPLILHILGT